MVKKILTQDRLKQLLQYDPVTGFWKWKKEYTNVGLSWGNGSVGGTGDTYLRVDGTLYKSHRLAFLYMTGAFPEGAVDHKNNIRTDNSWNNLRQCTIRQNNYNSIKRSNNTSGHKGVSWRSDRGCWTVRVSVKGQYKSFGSFDDFELACLVADEARDKYHGEFANNG